MPYSAEVVVVVVVVVGFVVAVVVVVVVVVLDFVFYWDIKDSPASAKHQY